MDKTHRKTEHKAETQEILIGKTYGSVIQMDRTLDTDMLIDRTNRTDN